MSAPDTKVEKQAKRHKGPLWGMFVALAWAGILLIAFLIWTVASSDDRTAEGEAAMTTVPEETTAIEE